MLKTLKPILFVAVGLLLVSLALPASAALGAPACPDMVVNGSVDASDLLAFAAGFAVGDLSVDFSGNGVVNDIDKAIIEFFLGKPVDCATFNAAAAGGPFDPVQLSIAKSDSLAAADPGQATTYTVTVSNAGGVVAVGVKVTDTLPGVYVNVKNITDGGVLTGNTLAWNNLTVPSFGSKVLSYQGQIASSLAVGTTTVTNTAALGCTDVVQCPYQGSAQDQTTVRVLPVQVVTSGVPVLSVSKTTNAAGPVSPGFEVEYIVTVSNLASATASAQNVSVTDVLPAGFRFKASGLSSTTFSLGTLEIGGTKSLTYTSVVGDTVVPGTYTNAATAQADNADPVAVTSPVDVAQLQVLGATVEEETAQDKATGVQVLAATGPSPLDFALYALGVAALSAGALGVRRFAARKT